MYELKYRSESDLKESGIEWLGSIPLDWKVTTLNRVLRSPIVDGPHETPNYVDTGVPFISVDSLSDSESVKIEGVNRFITESKFKEYNKKTKLTNGDILFSKSASIGKTAIVDERKFMTWSPLAIIKSDYDLVDNKFLYFILSSRRFIEHVTSFSNLNTQLNIGMKQLEKSRISLSPKIIEQQKISNFLEIKTAQFDNIIAKKEQLIKKLEEAKKSLISEVVTGKMKIVNGQLVPREDSEMKDSGVEWLGMVPKDWSIKRARYLFSESSLKSVKGKEEPLSMSQKYGLIKSSDMDRIPNQSLSNAGNKICKINDLVFNKLKSHLGVFSVSQYMGLVSPDYAVYKSLCGTSSKYYEYLFKTPLYINEFNKYSKGVGAGLTRLYTQDLFNIMCCYPNLNIQNEIADFISKKIIDADNIISKVEYELTKIREAKQSLISEAVTGKIDLKDWEIADGGGVQ